jgi:predicted RND superfamily exporter protein
MKRAALLGILVACGAVVLGIVRLRFDVEILNLLPENLPVAKGLELYQQYFSEARRIIATVEAPTPEEAEAAARSLALSLRAQTNLVARADWQPPWTEHPGQMSELIAFLWLNQSPSVCSNLVQRLRPENLATVLNDTRERLSTSFSPNELAAAGYDPLGLMQVPGAGAGFSPMQADSLFASADGTFRLVFVDAQPMLKSYRDCRDWVSALRREVTKVRVTGEIPDSARIHFTGQPVFVSEISGSMEKDMAGSAGGTLITIGILFWLTHRRIRPLLWLLLILMTILAGTLAVGGLLLGTLNVVSMGFAAILLGLAEDFGIVIYQESRSHPQLNAHELRRETAPGILWSALTTAGAFLILNLSVLPGLGQLGSLVAIGIVLGAVIMVYVYLPVLLRVRRSGDLAAPEPSERFLLFNARRLIPGRTLRVMTVLLVLACVMILWSRGVPFDRSANSLKPKESEAAATLDRIKKHINRGTDPIWVFVPGRSEVEVAQRLKKVEAWLLTAKTNRAIESFSLPSTLWPEVENQRANQPLLGNLAREREVLFQAVTNAGFQAASFELTRNILNFWQVRAPGVFWPSNEASRWIYRQMMERTTNGYLTLGFIQPATKSDLSRLVNEWPAEVSQEGIILSNWELLGPAVFNLVLRDLPKLLIPIALLVVVTLWCAFRSFTEIVLSLSTLLFSGLLLGAIMGLLGWEWNLLNLMALPLLLGMGVDYSIHMQLALIRHAGDRLAVQRSVGRALLLAGATTITGFASLGFSSNAGMASLGKVCALGIGVALLTAVYLLPAWWCLTKRGRT